VIHEQIVPNTIPTYPADYPMITFDPLSLAKMENDALRAENEALRQRVAALEKQLGR
jgi:cell division protein FtsB